MTSPGIPTFEPTAAAPPPAAGSPAAPAPVATPPPAAPTSTEAVYDAEDFYGSASDSPAPAAAAPASGTPAPAAPGTPAAGTPNAAAAADDNFGDLFDEPEVPAADAAPAGTPANAAASAGTPPPAAPATPPPATPPVDDAAPTTNQWQEVLKRFKLPADATPETLEAAIEATVNHRLELASDPQMQHLNDRLALSDPKAIIRQALADRQVSDRGYVHDEDYIDDEIAKAEANGGLEKWADNLKGRWTQEKSTIETGRAQQTAAQQAAQAAAETQQQQQLRAQYEKHFNDVRAAGQEYKGPNDKPFSAQVQKALIDDFALSGDLVKTLNRKLATDPKFVVQMAKMLHPEYGPRIAQMESTYARQAGSSDVWKQMDGADLKLGQGGGVPSQNAVQYTNADDYYN